MTTAEYARLEERILARDQVGASQALYTLLEQGRPLTEITSETVRIHAPYTHVPYHQRLDDGPRYNGQRNSLIERLGESASTSPDKFRGGIPQMLMLMNGAVTAEATSLDTSRTLRAVVDAPFLDESEKIQTLFLATLTRPPSEVEARRLKEHVEKQAARGESGQAYAEILWALINSPEFMLIR